MALKLDQIKKGKAPQRRNEDAVSFIKDKTMAPFEIPPPSNNDQIRVQLEHSTLQASPTVIESQLPYAAPEVLNASQLSEVAPLPFNQQNSDLGLLNESDKNGAQLEHNTLSSKSTNGAQLEHKSVPQEEYNNASDLNKSTIRAQLGVSQKSNKSTIRAQEKEVAKQNSDPQLEHSRLSNKSTNGAQYRAQLEHSHDANKNTNRVQLDYNKSSYQSTTDSSNRAQLEHKQLRSDFEMLSGHELNFLKYIHSNCVGNGNKTTSKINNQLIAEAIGIKPITLKTVVKRVTDKGFLSREAGKRGRGGWLQFTMSDELYSKMLYSFTHKSTIGVQSTENKSTDQSTTRSTELSSSSIIYNNINTNTEESIKSEPWMEINIPEVLKAKGFSQTHAKQILSDKDNVFTVEEVQQSFEHFAHDIENNLVLAVKRGVSAINFFMGILRKNGARNLYVSSSAAQKEHAEIELYLKAQKESGEILKQKAMAEIEMKAAEMVRELSSDERDSIAPPNKFMDSGSANQTLVLIRHFKQQSGFEE